VRTQYALNLRLYLVLISTPTAGTCTLNTALHKGANQAAVLHIDKAGCLQVACQILNLKLTLLPSCVGLLWIVELDEDGLSELFTKFGRVMSSRIISPEDEASGTSG
jgi:hypothetical protein